MKILFVIVAMLGFFASGCANEDGSKRTTKLVIDNSFSPSVHSEDCKDGMRIKVSVKGRTHTTPTVSYNDQWDYELTQGKHPIPYTIETICMTSKGKTLKSTVEGKIPAQDEEVILTGITIGPPRVLQAESCVNVEDGQPCVSHSN